MSWLTYSYEDNKHEKCKHGNYWKSPTKYVLALACNFPPSSIEIMHWFTEFELLEENQSKKKKREPAQGCNLAPFFGDWSQSETLSGIKPPLKDQSRDITAYGCFKPALRKPSL